MKIHFNSIELKGDEYIYEYHTQKNRNFRSTLGYLTIAGLIGSFKVVSEKGWLYLIPFWIVVFVLSKITDWIIKKWIIQSKSVKISFISKYPHYVLVDIFWMLKCTNQNFKLGEIITNASEKWAKEIDIEIGKLYAIKINKAKLTREVLDRALDQQEELEQKWSEKTGRKYPNLGMPKR
jgi:predicted nucleic-acid-binding Zn-ribbon protein